MTSPDHHLCFVIFPGFELLDLTGPLTVLSDAARLSPQHNWNIHVAARTPGPVPSGQGLSVVADLALHQLPDQSLHSVICVGGDPGPIEAALEDRAFIDAISCAGQKARYQISICSGTFLLAEAGLAAGKRVTSHWRAVNTLADRYPDLDVEADAIYCRDGSVWSSAGVTAGKDLALALVEQEMDRTLALKIARNLLIPRIRSGGQSQYSADLASQTSTDTRLTRLCQTVRQNPNTAWTIDDLCEHMHVSRRTLTRMCQSQLGLPPGQLVERLRVDLARSALVETDMSITDVAKTAGFSSLLRLERAFQRQLNTTPRGFRARFRSPHAQEITP